MNKVVSSTVSGRIRPFLANETFRLLRESSPLFLIAGPCALESPDLAYKTAETIQEIGERHNIVTVFKASFDKANRQSISSPRGVGLEKGLEILQRVKDKFGGMLITTDVHESSQCPHVAEVADILQIPAFLCRQTDLIVEASRTGRLVNIKKGQFASARTMQLAGGKVFENNLSSGGGAGLLLTERGTMFGYNDLVFDPRNLVTMRGPQQLVIQDITHSVQRLDGGASSAPSDGTVTAGSRHLVPTIARAAVAVGVNGVFVETHPEPESATCDKQNQWPLDKLDGLVAELVDIAQVTRGLAA